ncbi:MAG: hypothetical protein IKY31_08160 [Bacteroidaceae bacterium]|nr:hypothetical protein [Bacteroidaceae bacterium]
MSIFDTLDDEGNVTTDSSELIKQEIIDWIKKYCGGAEHNYNKIKIDYKDGKYIVNWAEDVIVSSDAPSLNNGLFVWGKIVGIFDCSECNKLKSLEGAPTEVLDFDCSICENLTSLEGAPQKVYGNFYCVDCMNLESLKGAPEEVGGIFDCSGCFKLTSPKGGAKKYRELRIPKHLR